jgi:chromate transport protein ChrA
MAGTAAPVDQQEIAPNIAPDIAPPITLWQIAHTFLFIGLASFSLAALDEARRWVTQKRKWFTEDEYLQGVGLAQLLPGAPSVNLCAYLGFRLRGLPGAAAATVSFLTPCFVLMLLLSHLYLKYGTLPVVSGVFRGLGALVVGLVFNTILKLAKSGVKTAFNWLMAVAGFAMVFWFRIGVLEILLVAGTASFVAFILTRRFPQLQRSRASKCLVYQRNRRGPQWKGPGMPYERAPNPALGKRPRLQREPTAIKSAKWKRDREGI